MLCVWCALDRREREGRGQGAGNSLDVDGGVMSELLGHGDKHDPAHRQAYGSVSLKSTLVIELGGD